MNKTYVFRRTKFVTLQSILLGLYIVIAAFVLLTDVSTRQILPLTFVFITTLILLYRGVKGMPITVKDDGFDMMGQFISTKRIVGIDFTETEIIVTVKRGTFLMGTKLKLKRQKMKDTLMWDSLVEDLKELKHKVTE